MQLQNKNIVIIGGTTGMGLSAASSFIREGAHLVVVGRNEHSVQEAGETLGAMGASFGIDKVAVCDGCANRRCFVGKPGVEIA